MVSERDLAGMIGHPLPGLPPAPHRRVADLTVAELRTALGIDELTRHVKAVAQEQGVLMSTIDDLRRAVAENNAADDAIIDAFEDLQRKVDELPKDRPLNANEQAAIDEAVASLRARTTAMIEATKSRPDTSTGGTTDTGVAPGNVLPGTNVPFTNGGDVQAPVELNAPAPTSVVGNQGGTIDLDDKSAVPTPGVPGALVDLSSSQPVAVVNEVQREDRIPEGPSDDAVEIVAETGQDDGKTDDNQGDSVGDNNGDRGDEGGQGVTPLSESDVPFPQPANTILPATPGHSVEQAGGTDGVHGNH